MLTRIDELLLPEYYYLQENDECWFLGEYTPRGGYQHSHTNDVVSNLKKEMDRRGRPEWVYKEKSIQQVAQELASALSIEQLQAFTWVPMPPSKARTDPLYDDRLLQVLQALPNADEIDIRELLEQRTSTRAAHLSDNRLKPHELRGNYRLAEHLWEPRPEIVAVFDDILNTGAHFRATKDLPPPSSPWF